MNGHRVCDFDRSYLDALHSAVLNSGGLGVGLVMCFASVKGA